MIKVSIAVMNYRDCSIKVYSAEFASGYTSDDVEDWLYYNADYNSDCEYMYSEESIEVEYV